MDSLEGVAAKVRRADGLLRELEQACIDHMFGLMDSGGRTVVPDPVRGAYRVTMILPPVPLEISVILGDLLHNLRSALDHLARVLVLRGGRAPKDGIGGTSFPILINRPGGGPRIKPATWTAAEALLDAVQPYSDPERRAQLHPLWLLHELNLTDKHRLLNVTALAGGGHVAFVPPPAHDTVLDVDHPRYSVRLTSGEEQVIDVQEPVLAVAEMAGQWSFTIVLGEGTEFWGTPLSTLALNIRNFVVGEVIGPFAKLELLAE